MAVLIDPQLTICVDRTLEDLVFPVALLRRRWWRLSIVDQGFVTGNSGGGDVPTTIHCNRERRTELQKTGENVEKVVTSHKLIAPFGDRQNRRQIAVEAREAEHWLRLRDSEVHTILAFSLATLGSFLFPFL